MWPDPAQNEANTAWVRDYYAATAPLSEEGGYVNFMAGDDQDRIKANYRGNCDRLVEVKRTYDPGNLFHVNQNIKPWGRFGRRAGSRACPVRGSVTRVDRARARSSLLP